MDFEIVSCKRSHIKAISAHLREEDSREIEEMSGCAPLRELLRCRLHSLSNERWAIVNGSKVLMVYGLLRIGVASSVAKMWMACSDEVSLANKFIVQETLPMIITALRKYRTLTGDIDKRHTTAVRFFKRVGCELEDGVSITGLPIYCAKLTKELFVMSKANKLMRSTDFRLEYNKG